MYASKNAHCQYLPRNLSLAGRRAAFRGFIHVVLTVVGIRNKTFTINW